jgi:hypothetical protein
MGDDWKHIQEDWYEVKMTWRIPFGYGRSGKDDFTKAYSKIWYLSRYHLSPCQMNSKSLGRFKSSSDELRFIYGDELKLVPCKHVWAHLKAHEYDLPNQLSYLDYPRFEEKLRALQY